MHRKRDEHTYWYNKAPVADIYQALYMLQKNFQDRGDRYIKMGQYDGKEPEIHMDWYREGSSGGDSSGTHYFEIKPEVVKELIDKGLVSKKRIKDWGSTYEEPSKLLLNSEGERELSLFHAEKKKLAHSLLEPGVHSKFSGIFNDFGKGREGYAGAGRLYFDFKTPQDEKVRVYPDTKEVVKLDEKSV